MRDIEKRENYVEAVVNDCDDDDGSDSGSDSNEDGNIDYVDTWNAFAWSLAAYL